MGMGDSSRELYTHYAGARETIHAGTSLSTPLVAASKPYSGNIQKEEEVRGQRVGKLARKLARVASNANVTNSSKSRHGSAHHVPGNQRSFGSDPSLVAKTSSKDVKGAPLPQERTDDETPERTGNHKRLHAKAEARRPSQQTVNGSSSSSSSGGLAELAGGDSSKPASTTAPSSLYSNFPRPPSALDPLKMAANA